MGASWNSEGEGVSWIGILKGWGGGNAVWSSNTLGGVSSEFQEQEGGESFA